MPTPSSQDFLGFARAEEDELRARLTAIRASIAYSGEKSVSAEAEILHLLRRFLPAEYGLGTGFIVHHADESIEETKSIKNGVTSYRYTYSPDKDVIRLSPRLDIIIYNAMQSGPILRLGECEVFPLEGVYGYVEVKTSIGKRKDKQGKTAIQRLFDQSNELRSMKSRLYWSPIKGSYTRAYAFPFPLRESMSIRSYAFILDADALGSKNDVQQIIQNDFRNDGGKDPFIDGVYVNGKGFYRSNTSGDALPPALREIFLFENAPLSEFKKALYVDLARFPRTPVRCTIAIDKYFSQTDEGVVGSTLVEENGKQTIKVG
jgi:hypothetical protein